MEKENFTAGRIASYAFKPSATGKTNQTIYWDAKTPGLCLRVTASGNKSFAFESKLHGRTIRITIGDIRTWSVGDAQKEATDLKSMVDKGVDPRKQRAEKKAEADAEHLEAERRETTFGDAWNAYISARKPKWSPRHFSDHEKVISKGKTPGSLGDLIDERLTGPRGRFSRNGAPYQEPEAAQYTRTDCGLSFAAVPAFGQCRRIYPAGRKAADRVLYGHDT